MDGGIDGHHPFDPGLDTLGQHKFRVNVRVSHLFLHA